MLRKLFRRPSVRIGAAVIAVVLLAALFAPLVAPIDLSAVNPVNRLQWPSLRHLFGTDDFGRDIFGRVVHGARISASVGLGVSALALTAGGFLGLVTGFFRTADSVLMVLLDGLMALPGIILAIALMGAMGPGLTTVIVALSVVYTPRVARVVRSSVIAVRSATFVEAANALGAANTRVILRHILPNCLSLIIVQASFVFSYAILGEAALSFLGVGVPPDIPTWGNMLSEGRVYMARAPWLTFFPGIAIMTTVLGMNLVGDGLRDMLDPRLRNL